MCQFFSCIVTRQGQVLFTEDDSHETIIHRARLRDTDRHLRHWVRVELLPQYDGWAPLFVDEAEMPAWWTEDAPALTDRVAQIADRVRPAWAAYCAAVQPARVAYDSAKLSAQAAYDAIEQSARATYAAALARIPGSAAARATWMTEIEQPTTQIADRVRAARAAYEAVKESAWAPYEAVKESRATWVAARRSAWATYEAAMQPARAAYAATLARIPGYCAAAKE